MHSDPPCPPACGDAMPSMTDTVSAHTCGYREMFETSPLGICRVSEDNAIVFANRALAALLGYESPERMQQIDDVRCVFAEVAARKALWRQLAKSRVAEGFECALRREDKSVVWVSLSVRAAHDAAGQTAGYNVFVTDITERKNAEVLRDEVGRLGRHDMKGPLNSIIGLTSLLQDDDQTDEERSILEMIERSAETMMDMIDTSLAVYQLEMGTARLRLTPVDPAFVVDGLAAELDSLIQAKDSCLEVAVSGPAGELVCDRLLVTAMLRHLLQNALEATPAGLPVRVEIEAGETMRLTVRNAGEVPAAVRGTFFEKFVTMGKKRGIGVGTYVVRLVAEAHGGRARFTSSREAGTAVTVQLPMSGPQAED